MAILKIRDANGNVHEILAIKGDAFTYDDLTDEQKEELFKSTVGNELKAELFGLNITSDNTEFEQNKGYFVANKTFIVNSTSSHIVIPIETTGCTFSILGNATKQTYYCGLKTYSIPENGSALDVSDTWNTVRILAVGGSATEIIPDDVKYICINALNNGIETAPQSFSITKEGGRISEIEKKIEELENEMGQSSGGTDGNSGEVDLENYTANNGYPSNYGTWASMSGTYKHKAIPITQEGCILNLTANENSTLVYAGLKSYTTPTANAAIDFSDEWYKRKELSASTSIEVEIPSDVTYLCVWTKVNGVDTTPSSISIRTPDDFGSIEKIERELDKAFEHTIVDPQNLYSGEQNVEGYKLNQGGTPTVTEGGVYASIPVDGGSTVYVCYGVAVDLSSSYVGTLRFSNNGTAVSNIQRIQEHVIDGDCRGYKVAKLKVPFNATRLDLNITISIDSKGTIYNATGTLLVSNTDLRLVRFGEEVTVDKINGIELRDNQARKQIEEINNRKVWQGKKWACVGDSLTDPTTGYTTHYYHDYIAERTGIEVVNMGVRGTAYSKATDGNNRFYDRIVNVPTDADVITIFGSFNDLAANLPIGEVNDTEPTTVAGYINATFDALYSIMPLAKVGVITPTPWDGFNEYEEGTASSDNAKAYVDLLIAICKKRSIPCLDLFRQSNLRPWDETFKNLAYYNADGTHPNATGHDIIAPKFLEFLKTLMMN